MTTTTHGAEAIRAPLPKPCGHDRHVGTCASCQRAQLARWQEQSEQVQAICLGTTPAGGATPSIAQ